MKKPSKKDLALFGIQVAVWATVILLPMLTTWLATRNWEYTKQTVQIAYGMLQSPMLLYFANFYIFDSLLFQRRHYGWFALANLLLMVVLNWGMFFIGDYAPELPAVAWVGFFIGFFIYFLLNCAMIAAALGIRHFIRVRRIRQQLKEEKTRHTEAELAWLKNQINPHFLFNTLNNISSLTQIDADAAQDAIAQLSDLLRYAMYETNKKMVPVEGEVSFMRNYIGLMKLRCNEKTVVNVEWSVANSQQEIAPLLFVSLIENAFKHGVSSSRPSTIDIRLEEQPGQLVFTCDNTNYPKDDADRSGSGIGLENTRRRLELLYHDRFTWEQSITPDNIYHVRIVLKTN